MKTLSLVFLLLVARNELLAQCNPPFSHTNATSICFGFALAKAWGCSDVDALTIYTENVASHSAYFVEIGGSDYVEGDVVVMASLGTGINSINRWNGHAFYVSEVRSSTVPDGKLTKGQTGIYRDDDPSPNENVVIIKQVRNIGATTWETMTLSEVKSYWQQYAGYVILARYRLRESAMPYTVTLQNSFQGGKIQVGKFGSGDYVDKESPYPEKYSLNSQIKAKAVSNQTIGGNKWVFANQWKKGEQIVGTTDSLLIYVTESAAYAAQFSPASASNYVVFQNYSDGVHIGSIIKVNGEDKVSPTQQFPLGATAQAYPSLQANRVQYQFSQWSTGSTNTTITPTSPGTYSVYYAFQYVLPPLGVNPFAGGYGNNIKIVWRQHPSPYVTEYKIWRQVKDVHGPMVVATLAPTVTSWTDWSYALTEGYSDKLISYDVRAHFVIPGTRDDWSNANWIWVYGTDGIMAKRAPGPELALVEAPASNDYSLQASPNPFNPVTTLTYSLKEEAYVEMAVYDLQGRAVHELVGGIVSQGKHTVRWEASARSTGAYFVRFNAIPLSGGESFSTVLRIFLVK